MDKYPVKKYPEVGACGLNCNLCPRYHMESASKCPGCCGPGFWQKHPSCSLITCTIKQKGLETCVLCHEFDSGARIARVLKSAGHIDSFISCRNVPDNLSFIRERGIEEFVRLARQRQNILQHLLANFNDGRAKGFLCISCQLLPLERLKQAVKAGESEITPGTEIKEKARIMRAVISRVAEELNIDLRLRKGERIREEALLHSLDAIK